MTAATTTRPKGRHASVRQARADALAQFIAARGGALRLTRQALDNLDAHGHAGPLLDGALEALARDGRARLGAEGGCVVVQLTGGPR
jgi:hypothetical protein